MSVGNLSICPTRPPIMEFVKDDEKAISVFNIVATLVAAFVLASLTVVLALFVTL